MWKDRKRPNEGIFHRVNVTLVRAAAPALVRRRSAFVQVPQAPQVKTKQRLAASSAQINMLSLKVEELFPH